MTDFTVEFKKYFGTEPGGVDLISSLEGICSESLNRLFYKVENCRGRLFFMGNGGSYDNARWMAQLCREKGLTAKVPGVEEDYITTLNRNGYESIFKEGLKADFINEEDLVIGLSGSGNSQNIILAFEFALQKGASVFALGGRDGGEMLQQIGSENCLIASNKCMEAIEDLHNFAFYSVLEAMEKKRPVQSVKHNLVNEVRAFCSPINFQQMAALASGMVNTVLNGGRTFILGTGIGANHFRADMGRGATNALPIRGVAAPEVFTMNSLQATANDDGTDFILADGLVKYEPSEKDFAVLCPGPGEERCFDICEEILLDRHVGYTFIDNNRGVDAQAFSAEKNDLAVTLVGHACGKVINEHLNSIFKVRAIDFNVEYKPGQRKLSSSETLYLEKRLRSENIISAGEILTFCYGNVFAVSAENQFKREYY